MLFNIYIIGSQHRWSRRLISGPWGLRGKRLPLITSSVSPSGCSPTDAAGTEMILSLSGSPTWERPPHRLPERAESGLPAAAASNKIRNPQIKCRDCGRGCLWSTTIWIFAPIAHNSLKVGNHCLKTYTFSVLLFPCKRTVRSASVCLATPWIVLSSSGNGWEQNSCNFKRSCTLMLPSVMNITHRWLLAKVIT